MNRPIYIAVLFILVMALSLGFAYTLATTDTEPERGEVTVPRFSVERVAENSLIIRNQGEVPLEKNTLKVSVNGREMDYRQPSAIAPGSVGEFRLPLSEGDCSIEVMVSGGSWERTINTDLCLYYEGFNGTGEWIFPEGTGTSAGGIMSFNGLALGNTSIDNKGWMMETRVKGAPPNILFMYRAGESYEFTVNRRDNLSTEIFFDKEEDSYVYNWGWKEDVWYRIRIASEGGGIYFGKVWKDGTPEPESWTVFMVDTDREEGVLGLRNLGGETSVDFIRVYPQ